MSKTRASLSSLRARFILLSAACALFLLLVSGWLRGSSAASPVLGIRAVSVFALIVTVAMSGLRAHPFANPGYANGVTTFRGALVALVAALVAEPQTTHTAWTTIVVASIAAALDGWDGWLARRTRMQSAFGARFDMEVDALLILLLSVFVWRYGKAGAWVLVSGALRYGFVAAGWMLPWLNRPLLDSTRRKAVCVVQIVGLIVAIGPIIPTELSAFIAAVTLAALMWSFWVDVTWLRKSRLLGI